MKTEKLILGAILCFNVFTLLMYVITPLSVNSGNHLLNLVYISFNILMMYFGFCSSLNKLHSKGNIRATVMSLKIYNILLLFYLATFTLRYSYIFYLPPLNIVALVNRIAIGVSDPHLGRTIMHGGRTLPWSFFFLMSVIDSVFFIISLISWKKINNMGRFVIVLLLLLEALFWMGSGTNFGVIMLVSCIVLSALMQIRQNEVSKKKFIKLFAGGILAFVVVIMVFSYNMEGRSGGDFTNLKGDAFLALGPSVTISANSWFEVLPYRIQVLLLFMFSYLTQGYVFLEYIYDLNFHWGGFFGNNPAMQSLATDFLGFNPEINSYQSQMERLGVDSYVNWHSCYLWLANDFTLLFVPLVVFYVAKLAGSALIMFRKSEDIFSGLVFVIFANVLLFMFANNNYLSSVFYSFMFIFPYWYINRYKRFING